MILNDKNELSGVDIAKFIFACLIPLLHIPFGKLGGGMIFICQYISRLGVPFFFSAAGLFLSNSIETRGNTVALKRYAKRVGRMLLLWLIIYSPILYIILDECKNPFQILICKTPGYLWYLTGLLVAIVPFCLFQNRRVLYIICLALYVIGTFTGGSYSWISGGWPLYEKYFITTRNGIFFGLPLLCIGELTMNKYISLNKRWKFYGLIISMTLLFIEITIVQQHILPNADCSMYFMLPVAMYFAINTLKEVKLSYNTKPLRGISSAIYVIQFGIITVLTKSLEYFKVKMTIGGIVIYITVIASGFVLYWLTIKRPRLACLI